MDETSFSKLLQLARLSCSPEERELFYASLNKILQHIETLQSINTEGVEACHTVLKSTERATRKDSPSCYLSQQEFIRNAPDSVAGMVRVPVVLQDGEEGA